MAFKTRITELLGVGHPIVRGGMQGAGTAGLARAGSNGGGGGDLAKGEFGAGLVGDAQAIIRQRLQTRRGVA